MVHSCLLSRHSTPINAFVQFLQQKIEPFVPVDLYDSGNTSLMIENIAWAPHPTEPKLRIRVGWTKMLFF